MKKMSAIDTPLNTAQMMMERQQLGQTPYVVLSGGGKNLLTTYVLLVHQLTSLPRNRSAV